MSNPTNKNYLIYNFELYDFNKLYELSLPISIVNITVDNISHLLVWNYVDKPRVDRAILTYPILICKLNDSDNLIMLDGMHRLQKAVWNNTKTLPCKYLTEEMLDACIIKDN